MGKCVRPVFPWVWISILLILASGFWMIFGVYGGMGGLALHVHLMFGMGLTMMLVFCYIYFVPYAALRKAVATEDWPAGGQALAGIRRGGAILHGIFCWCRVRQTCSCPLQRYRAIRSALTPCKPHPPTAQPFHFASKSSGNPPQSVMRIRLRLLPRPDSIMTCFLVTLNVLARYLMR